MHGEREHLEARITRARAELIPVLIERASTPLAVRAGSPNGDSHEPMSVGDPWGPPWSTTWFAFDGIVAEHWAGGDVEAVIDLGAPPDAVGFSAEGLVVDTDGRPRHGLHPRRQTVALASDPGPVRIHVEAAVEPGVLAVRAVAVGRSPHRRDPALVPDAARRPGARRRRGPCPLARPGRPRRSDAHLGAGRPSSSPPARHPLPLPGPAARCQRGPGGAGAGALAACAAPARIASSPSATPTSTPRGSGRCARRYASASAPLRRPWT